MAKSNRRKKPKIDNRIPPTLEQDLRAQFVHDGKTKSGFASAGMAYRRIAVIETMLTRGQITDREFVLLDYYRQQASLADSSPIKSNIDFSLTGGDLGPSAAITSAILETARIERDMGSLWALARDVAVNDVSLTEYCIAKHGGRERYGPKGNFIAMVPVREKDVIAMALMELRMAARRIVK